MKVLFIGDIYGRIGRESAASYIDRYANDADLIIANGENAAHGRGITKPVYEELIRAGIDGITLGNHTWGCPDVKRLLDFEENIIRPLNFDKGCPGRGSMIIKAKNGVEVGVINIIGRTFMQPADSPFAAAEEEAKRLREKVKIILVDFHAEATSEKIAMGYFLDGRVSAVVGTHTHVQTADACILPGGTGYITDLGMCGVIHSVLGVEKNSVIRKFLTNIPEKFEPATGAGRFCGCMLDISEETGKTQHIERISADI